MKNNKFLSVCLCAAVFASCITACGETGTSPVETSAGTDTTPVTEEVTVDIYKTDLPDDLDFGGKTFRIYGFDMGSFDAVMDVQELNGDVYDEAIYKRNRAVEDRLNIVFSETYNGDMTSDGKRAVSKQVMSADDFTDLTQINDRDAWSLAQENYVIPINDFKYIDLSKPYWTKSINDNMTIHNDLYFAVGDYNTVAYQMINVLLVNQRLMSAYDLGDIYDIVDSGKWTLDLMNEMMLAVAADTNGDSTYDDQDMYGITAHNKHMLPNFWISGGLLTVDKNEQDEPRFIMATSDEFASFYMKFLNLMHSNNVYYDAEKITPDYADNHVFFNGQSLFTIVRCTWMDRYRDMEDQFGIIPCPKLTEAQDKYYSRLESLSLCFTPVTASDTDFVGAVLEEWSSQSAKIVVPTYYDIVLKSKYTRDEESVKMLDMLFENRIYDWGDTIWSGQIRDGVLAGKFKTNNTDLASTIASLNPKVEKLIAELIATFDTEGY